MDLQSSFFYSILFVLAVFSIISVWKTSSRLARLTIVSLFTLSCTLVFFGLNEMPGNPKKVFREILRKNEEEAVLISSIISRENKKIYLLLGLKGKEHPMYYEVDWSEELENRLREVERRRSKADVYQIVIEKPFKNLAELGLSSPHGGVLGAEEVIHPRPWPANPPKDTRGLSNQDILSMEKRQDR